MDYLPYGKNDRVLNMPFFTWISPLWFVHLKNENDTMASVDQYTTLGWNLFPLRIVFISSRYYIQYL